MNMLNRIIVWAIFMFAPFFVLPQGVFTYTDNSDTIVIDWTNTNLLKLPEQINSSYFELTPLLHPSGSMLLFSRMHYPYLGMDANIWYSIYDDELQQWQKAQELKELNNNCSNAIYGVSSDGRFFLTPNIFNGRKCLNGVQLYELVGERFLAPVSQKIKKFYNYSANISASMSVNGKILILSIERDITCGGQDLYVSFNHRGNNWTEPKHMGCILNSEGDDITPYLMPDNKTLFFHRMDTLEMVGRTCFTLKD